MANESNNEPTITMSSKRAVLIYSSSIVIQSPLRNNALLQLVPIFKEDHDIDPQQILGKANNTRVHSVAQTKQRTVGQRTDHQSPPTSDGSIGRKELCELWWKNCPYDCNAHLPSTLTSLCCDDYCKPVRQIVPFLSRKILSIVMDPSSLSIDQSTSNPTTVPQNQQQSPILIHPDCKCKTLVHLLSMNETNNIDPSIAILIGKDRMNPWMMFRLNEVSSEKAMETDNRALVTPITVGKRYAITNSTKSSRTTSSSSSSAKKKRSILPSSKTTVVTPVIIGTSSAEAKSTLRSSSSNRRTRSILSTPKHNQHYEESNAFWIESKKPSSSLTRSSSVSSKTNVSNRYERRKLLRRRIFDDSSCDENDDHDDKNRMDDTTSCISSLRVSLLHNRYNDFLSMEIDQNSSSDESYNFAKRRLIRRKRKREKDDIDTERSNGKRGLSTSTKRSKRDRQSNKECGDNDEVGCPEAAKSLSSRRLSESNSPEKDATTQDPLSNNEDGDLNEELNQYRSTAPSRSVSKDLNVSIDETTGIDKTFSNEIQFRTKGDSQYQRIAAHDTKAADTTKHELMKSPDSACNQCGQNQIDSKQNLVVCSTIATAQMDNGNGENYALEHAPSVKPFTSSATIALTQPNHDDFRRGDNCSKVNLNEVNKPCSSSTLFSNVTEDPPTPTSQIAISEQKHLLPSLEGILDKVEDPNATKQPRDGLNRSFPGQNDLAEPKDVQISKPLEASPYNENSLNLNGFGAKEKAKQDGSACKDTVKTADTTVRKEIQEGVELLTPNVRANDSFDETALCRDRRESLLVSKQSFATDDPSTNKSVLDNGLISHDHNGCGMSASVKSNFQPLEIKGDDAGSDKQNDEETTKSACPESYVLSLPFPATLDESESAANQSSAISKRDYILNNDNEVHARKQPTLCWNNTLQDWIRLQKNGCASSSFRSSIVELIVMKNRDNKSDQELWLPALFTDNTIIE